MMAVMRCHDCDGGDEVVMTVMVVMRCHDLAIVMMQGTRNLLAGRNAKYYCSAPSNIK